MQRAGDRKTPACSNCASSKHPRKCVYGDLKIRHSTYTTKVSENLGNELGEASARDTGLSPAHSQNKDCVAETAIERLPGRSPLEARPTPREALHTSSGDQGQTDNPVFTPVELHQPVPNHCLSSCAWNTQATPVDVGASSFMNQSTPSAILSNSAGRLYCSSHTKRTNISPLEKRVFEFYLDHAGPWVSRSPKPRSVTNIDPPRSSTLCPRTRILGGQYPN